jgi:hypothetical protein
MARFIFHPGRASWAMTITEEQYRLQQANEQANWPETGGYQGQSGGYKMRAYESPGET